MLVLGRLCVRGKAFVPFDLPDHRQQVDPMVVVVAFQCDRAIIFYIFIIGNLCFQRFLFFLNIAHTHTLISFGFFLEFFLIEYVRFFCFYADG